MDLTFDISTFSKESASQLHTTDLYQYWIILSGSAIFSCNSTHFQLQSHDLLELPPNLNFELQCEQLCIGQITLTDFLATNTVPKYFSHQSTEAIRKIFYLALDLQGMHFIQCSDFHAPLCQLMMTALMSITQIKLETSPEIFALITDLNEHYLDPDYSIKDAIQRTGYSESHMRKIFHNEVGLSPLQYVINRRLEHAKMLIHNDTRTLSLREIAAESGFSDPYYFSRLFKAKEHLSPKEYVNMINEQTKK